MKIALISGSHRRHSSIARNLFEHGLLSAWVIEHVAEELPVAPADCSPRLKELFDQHFRKRLEAEIRFFSEAWRPPQDEVPMLQIQAKELNDAATSEFLQAAEADLVISYGCNKIGGELMRAIGTPFWNCHGGLSPWYKGVATHFWPSFLLEPQMTGLTLHETSEQLDGGGIIHQTAAPLVRGDGIHDIACRAVDGFASNLPLVVKRLLEGGSVPAGIPQTASGRLWRYSDWRPEHLYTIYDYLQDSVVDRVLDGQFAGREPKLVSLVPDLVA